ncbi:MAG: hypothetical protein LBP59_03745 [Planctomycetaceae bacterium]|jgi:hypothetical protein|nr:hypothetical protein [Planctomycetaceae bacterium]
MKRLSLHIVCVICLFCVSGIAYISTFAAPPFAPELRRYQYAYQYEPIYIVPQNRIIQPRNGVAYPLNATATNSNATEPEYTEYVIPPQPSTQITQFTPTRKAPVIRSRSGRYYTQTPIISEPEIIEPNATNLPMPILAPQLQPTEPTQPPQTTKTIKSSQQTPLDQNLIETTNENYTKNNAENLPPQLDSLNARLAKMQLEKKNLNGTLQSIDKIKNAAFKVQTLVDLAEYVSRDVNYKKEADHLFNLALAATDAYAKKQPIIITYPDANYKPNATQNQPTKNTKNKTTKFIFENETKLDTKPDLKPDAKLDTKLDTKTETKLDPKLDPIAENETTKNPTTKTESKNKENKIIDLKDNDLEEIIVPPKPKNRQPLIKEPTTLDLAPNNNTNTDTETNTNKPDAKKNKPPLIINQQINDTKLKLQDPVKMTLEDYQSLNKNNSKPTTEPTTKPTTDKNTEKITEPATKPNNTNDPAELLTPTTEEQPKTKKKPTRPRKPLTTN